MPASAAESKGGELGYVGNMNMKPRRVRAVTANIPVATESLQKYHSIQGEILSFLSLRYRILGSEVEGHWTDDFPNYGTSVK